VAAPIALDAAGLTAEAQRLRDLPPVTASSVARSAVRSADAASSAASYAVRSARSADAVRSELVAACIALLDRLCPPLPVENTAALRWDRTAHIVGI
jgi:hypothetical protein